MIIRIALQVIIVVLLVAGGSVFYVRTTPIPVDSVHLRSPLSGLGHLEKSNGHIWRGAQVDDGIAQLTRLDGVITTTPRTERMKGSIEEGIITYVTYSRWWRFPDITTVERTIAPPPMGGPVIAINARALYGLLDLGVNRRRVTMWLDVFKA